MSREKRPVEHARIDGASCWSGARRVWYGIQMGPRPAHGLNESVLSATEKKHRKASHMATHRPRPRCRLSCVPQGPRCREFEIAGDPKAPRQSGSVPACSATLIKSLPSPSLLLSHPCRLLGGADGRREASPTEPASETPSVCLAPPLRQPHGANLPVSRIRCSRVRIGQCCARTDTLPGRRRGFTQPRLGPMM